MQIGKQSKKLQLLAVSNLAIFSFHTILLTNRLIAGEIRHLWDDILHLFQVEALQHRW